MPGTERPGSRRRFLFAAALLAAGCGKKAPRLPRLPVGATVLAFGDSLTAGNGAPPQASYPAELARRTGWNVVNGGVAGNTSAQALERLPALLDEHRPQLTLVSIGGNDFLRQVPEADIRAAIGAMLAAIRAAACQPLLIAVPRPTIAGALLRSLDDHPLYEALADVHRVPLFAQAWSRVLSDPKLKADHIHANAEGYARFALELHRFLRELGAAGD